MFLQVNRSLPGIGGKQLISEPGIWTFKGSNEEVIGAVASYLDTFLIYGDFHDDDFLKMRKKIQEMCRWGA